VKGVRVSFGPGFRNEIAAIRVDGTGQPVDRVGHRMDDVGTEGGRLPLADRDLAPAASMLAPFFGTESRRQKMLSSRPV
jgi:hypothetical protein